MKILFHGAVRTVTGSLHIIESSRGEYILLDCGLFQGRRRDAHEVNEQLPVDPKLVKAVVLSHGHIDHIGNLPTWVSKGLKCPVFTTRATLDICGIMLRDSAHIQEWDAAHVNKHRRKWEKPVKPLYDVKHAEAALKLLHPQKYRQWFDVRPGLRAIFYDAGHILGSASVVLEDLHRGMKKRLSFTGDVGRTTRVILKDPAPFPNGSDVVISECTYGDRLHPPRADLAIELRKVVEETVKRGGKLLIPAFALGRTQALLYVLYGLQKKGLLPKVPVFVDSPLATRATEIVHAHPECYDSEAREVYRDSGSIFALNGYSCVSSVEASKALNVRRGPCIIISASGMCEAGRILHHLVHALEDERNTILIVGFQADHTLGRKLVEKWPTVRIFGRKKQVKAHVKVINGFSGHADRDELTSYLEQARPAGPLFLVHGDERQATAFEEHLEGLGFPDVRIPYKGHEWKV